MTFGMMFGSHQTNMDDWSTDEDPDGDYDDDDDEDDDEEEDEYLPDEYYEDAAASGGNAKQDTALWEPQVKQYSNMNLKDQVSKAREGDAKVDEEKRQRLAKKRAEKRKKQKEKKSAKAQISNDDECDENDYGSLTSSSNKKLEDALASPESLEK